MAGLSARRVQNRLAKTDIETGRRARSGALIAGDLSSRHHRRLHAGPRRHRAQCRRSSATVRGADPMIVAEMGRSVCGAPRRRRAAGRQAFRSGRATSDSHQTLPVVDADLATLDASDFAPFAALSDMPMAMTSHIVYSAIDCERPATTSPAMIRDIIRQRIGFDGLLMSDDVSMKALSGDYADRAHATYAAGCDLVLHCNGRIEEMRTIALAAPPLAGIAGERAVRALSRRRQPKAFDRDACREELLALAARAGWMRVS
jgi:beta-N-acetylhexosaminidase